MVAVAQVGAVVATTDKKKEQASVESAVYAQTIAYVYVCIHQASVPCRACDKTNAGGWRSASC